MTGSPTARQAWLPEGEAPARTSIGAAALMVPPSPRPSVIYCHSVSAPPLSL